MIELLPIKKNNLFVCRKTKYNALRLFNNILSDAIEACQNFINKNYYLFDAQVGGTSCQIRAYKIGMLAADPVFVEAVNTVLIKLIRCKNNLDDYLSEYNEKMIAYHSYSKDLDKKETLGQLLENREFKLDDNLKFVVLSFFLKFCRVGKCAN